MRGHTAHPKPSGHTAHSSRRSRTAVLHTRMPADAGEAGHGPKSDAHANCGNNEKYGKGRLWAPASWALIGGSADRQSNEAQPPRWPADDTRQHARLSAHVLPGACDAVHQAHRPRSGRGEAFRPGVSPTRLRRGAIGTSYKPGGISAARVQPAHLNRRIRHCPPAIVDSCSTG